MLKGVGASSGIGIGTIVCIREESLDYSKVVFQGEAEEKARGKNNFGRFLCHPGYKCRINLRNSGLFRSETTADSGF